MNKKRFMKMALQYFATTEEILPIYNYVVANEITAYWEEAKTAMDPYLGETLWPREIQQVSTRLEWIKGAGGLSVVLKPSAYDVEALKRKRIGFQAFSAQMPFFKEAMVIDEEMRRMLLNVSSSGNAAYIETIISNIFADEVILLEGAAAQRERMRMAALTTGYINIVANGQEYYYDYGMPEENKVEPVKPWTDPTVDIISDITEWMDIPDVKPSRAVMRKSMMKYFRQNELIRKAINGSDSTAPVTDSAIKLYISDALGLKIETYDKKYINESGSQQYYIPDDTFVMFPAGELGTGYYSVTPEQADLMAGTSAVVSITDTGVAVTTSKRIDPVNVETKVSMIYLPSFEQANNVIIVS